MTSRTSVEAWLEQSTPPLPFSGLSYNMTEPGYINPRTDATSISAPPTTIDSKSSQSTEPKPPKDPLWVGRRLRSYNCFQHEEGALQRYPSFERLVQKIINQKRESTVNPDSAKKFQKLHQYYERANKDTFLHNVLPMIMKPTRKVKSRVRADALGLQEETQFQMQDQEDQEDQERREEGPERDIWKDDTTSTYEQVAEQEEGSSSGPRPAQEDTEYSVESFWDDGLAVKVDCEFRKGFFPARDGDEEIGKAMAKVDGMTNPKPDYTYGLRIDYYPTPDDVILSAQIDFLLEVVPILHHPFFIIEGKSDSGSKAEAENQACRGGATLVNATRQLLATIGAQEATGPDQQTFIYSATLSPGLMDIFVHWAEVRTKTGPVFHMHRLDSISLHGAGAIGKLRRITHNILDWGCVERSTRLQEVYNQIFAYERANQEERRKRLAEKTPSKKRKGNDRYAWS